MTSEKLVFSVAKGLLEYAATINDWPPIKFLAKESEKFSGLIEGHLVTVSALKIKSD